MSSEQNMVKPDRHVGRDAVLRLMAVVLAVAVLNACSADAEVSTADGTAADGEISTADGTVADAEAAGFSVAAALAQLPASAADEAGSGLEVYAADLEVGADQAGLTPPADPTDPEQVFEFISALAGPTDGRRARLFVPLPADLLTAAGNTEAAVDELGFAVASIASFVSVEAPPARFLVVSGVELPEGLPEIAPGVGTIGSGEDGEIDPEHRTAIRPLGRPLRVAEQDGQVALSPWTDPVTDWLDGAPSGTLASDPTLAALAEQLDAESVISAAMFVFDGRPYRGVGLGWAADDRGPLGVAVFDYASTAEAELDRARVEAGFAGDGDGSDAPVAEYLAVQTLEIRGSAIVAVVEFPPDSMPDRLYQLLLRGEGPFAP